MLCDRCKRPVRTTASDPLLVTHLGRMHASCMRTAWEEIRAQKDRERNRQSERAWKVYREERAKQ